MTDSGPRHGAHHGPHHGEYKVPGGKLVVIDLEVSDGRFVNVMLSGDFFLEPPEALASITGAVEGAPADSEPEILTARIVENLPPGAPTRSTRLWSW
ncbi:MAG TPA: hypothetical protein VF168_07765 [Trueperaceae bacterium]